MSADQKPIAASTMTPLKDAPANLEPSHPEPVRSSATYSTLVKMFGVMNQPPTTLTGGASLYGCPQVTSVSLGLVNNILLDSLPALTVLGPLSEGLTSLDLERVPQLSTLPALPSTLTSLSLGTTGMTSLPPLPEGLISISALGMPLSVLPDLPSSLQSLGLETCPLLTAVPSLPAGLNSMSLYELPLLTSVPTLPDGMTALGLTELDAVTQLPSLPPALTLLQLDSLPCTQLPDLPNGIETLRIVDVPLVMLAALPSSLLSFYIDHTSLTELPALPSVLSSLNLRNTPLNCLPMLPASLYNFQVTNTNLSCQPNFPPNPPPVFPLCTLTSSTCPELSATISGTVYWDRNASGTREPNEPGLPHVTLSTSTEVYLTATDSAGHYTLAVQPGDLTVQPIPPIYTLAVLPATTEVTALVLDTMISGIDFGVLLDTLLPDMSVVGWWLQAPRNDVPRQFRVHVTNTGTTQAPAEVSLLLPEGLELVTCDQPPVIDGSELTWQLDSLPMGAEVNFTCAFNAPLPLLTAITLTAHIGPIEEDIDTTNNTFNSEATITGSYDPNDKTVRPAQLTPAEGEDGRRVEYLIRFQNTGTAEALRVLVIDTLDPALDPLTVSFLGASHACQWFFRDGALHFLFDPIFLPDSTTDETGSHGSILFSIATRPGLAQGDSVPNEADIYFDLNAPVITDPCNVVVELSTSITEEVKDGIGVFPQPTTGPVFLWQDGSWNGARYDLYDIRGARLATGDITSPLLTLDLSGQLAGMYLLHVQRGAKTVSLRLLRE